MGPCYHCLTEKPGYKALKADMCFVHYCSFFKKKDCSGLHNVAVKGSFTNYRRGSGHSNLDAQGNILLINSNYLRHRRVFFWLVLHGRCWTPEIRFRHGLQESSTCIL